MNPIHDELPYFIVGASGHAKVVAALLYAQGKSIKGFIDRHQDNAFYRDLAILGDDNYLAQCQADAFNVGLGIGDNSLREKLYQLHQKSHFFPTLIHPSAHVEPDALLKEASVICMNAIIGVEAKIGAGVIVNTNAIIDHECDIGDFSHISVGTRLAGRVKVGQKSFIGIGASIIDQVTIGENSIIGAGSVVVSDIPDNVVAVGVPAKIVKQR